MVPAPLRADSRQDRLHHAQISRRPSPISKRDARRPPGSGISGRNGGARPEVGVCTLFLSLYEPPSRFPVAGVPYRRELWVSSVAVYVRQSR